MSLVSASNQAVTKSAQGGDRQTAMVGRQIRELKRMTLRGVAEVTARSIGHLSQIEHGVTEPTLRVMSDIATALGVQIGWFFSNQESVPPDELGIIVR